MQEQQCIEFCDIENYLYFGDDPVLTGVDLNIQNESIKRLINDALIIQDRPLALSNLSADVPTEQTIAKNQLFEHFDESVVAEISVSNNYSSISPSSSKKDRMKQKIKRTNKNSVYWIPILDIDEHGIALIDYKLESRNKPIFLYIQGVSHFGQVGNQMIKIDPQSIAVRKKAD